MSNPEPVLTNLIRFKAPDLSGPGEILGVRVSPEDKEWLRQQEGGLSYNTRRAISLYRKLLENPDLMDNL